MLSVLISHTQIIMRQSARGKFAEDAFVQGIDCGDGVHEVCLPLNSPSRVHETRMALCTSVTRAGALRLPFHQTKVMSGRWIPAAGAKAEKARMFTNAGICEQPAPAPAKAPAPAHPLEQRSLWAKSSLPEWARGTPAPGAPLHRALVPATGEERPPRKGQAEPRTHTSVSRWPCAPHFTLSRALPHAPAHSQQGAQSRRPTCTGRAGAGGGKDRAQEPRNKPPEAGRTAPAGQGRAETARQPWGRSLARQDRPPPLDKARAVSEEYGPAFKALTIRRTQGAHSHEDPRLGRQGPGRAVRARESGPSPPARPELQE